MTWINHQGTKATELVLECITGSMVGRDMMSLALCPQTLSLEVVVAWFLLATMWDPFISEYKNRAVLKEGLEKYIKLWKLKLEVDSQESFFFPMVEMSNIRGHRFKVRAEMFKGWTVESGQPHVLVGQCGSRKAEIHLPIGLRKRVVTCWSWQAGWNIPWWPQATRTTIYKSNSRQIRVSLLEWTVTSTPARELTSSWNWELKWSLK